MRPSASVTPRAMTLLCFSTATAIPAAGRPVAVSRTWVERVAMGGRYRTPRDENAPHHRRTVHLQGAARGAGRAEDLRRDHEAPPAPEQAGPLPVEWRI